MCEIESLVESIGLYPPIADRFAEGAYYISEIGGNDLFYSTSALNLSAGVVIASFVPAAADAVKQAITVSATLWSPHLLG